MSDSLPFSSALRLQSCGALLGVAGRDDPVGLHGALIFVAAVLTIFGIGGDYFAAEPSEERLARYYDDPSKAGIVLAMIWLVFGLAIGDWVAWQLVNPDLTFGPAWSSFGRLRPVHTTSVIFGFGGNGLIATSLYVLQRTTRARLPDASPTANSIGKVEPSLRSPTTMRPMPMIRRSPVDR